LSRKARPVRFALRTLVGVAVVGYLLTRANIADLGVALRSANVRLLAAGAATFFASLLLGSLRWEAFLHALGLRPARSGLIRLYLIGTFFNAFLPTGFGGDAYKSVVLGRGRASTEAALATAGLDRLTGLVGLGAVTLISVAVELLGRDGTVVTWFSAALSLAIVGGAAAAVISMPPIGNRSPAPSLSPLRRRIRVLVDALVVGARHPRALRIASIWGFVTAVLLVSALGFLLAAVHADVPPGALAGVVFLGSLAAIIPLSINGLGFREATYVWALGAYGVSANDALAFALFVLAVTLLASVIGGAVYAIGGAALPRGLEDVQDGRDEQEVDAD
jgi:glycosyltransferase 2 family protein